MKSLRILATLLACSLFTVAALAADASGTWKWSQSFGRDGTAREVSVNLTVQADKVTGTFAGGRGEPLAISNGSIKGDTIAFEVRREFNGNAFVTKYSGKIEGDTLRGTMVIPGFNGGEPRSVEFVATRAK